MRVLLSTIGSRGDVQPLIALALELRATGQEVRLCVPPDFQSGITQLGIPVTPIGPELRSTARPTGSAMPLTAERRQQMMESTIKTQFETLCIAARDCDFLVGATALQIAAPSVAERMGIPYVFVAYCPAVLPSPRHAPPMLSMSGDVPMPQSIDYSEMWAQDAQRWNDTWSALINSHRKSVGLPPINDVRRYVLTDRPWLAADTTLAPWPSATDDTVFQTEAWILPDKRPLPKEIEAFLEAGEPPIYIGFGSIRIPESLGKSIIESALALNKRAIVSRGWAELSLIDSAPNCLAIDEVNQQLLFKRVAVAVHHGGAGTTTVAAKAGVPQVVLPQFYDQHYWARRVDDLGIGIAHTEKPPTKESLTSALKRALTRDVVIRAQSVASVMRGDGAQVAARHVISPRDDG